ncbi:MAG: hypothetical protein JWP87_6026 [Labilithrix sp.]|nr:hypothetical protein [Labilithrix sp.]
MHIRTSLLSVLLCVATFTTGCASSRDDGGDDPVGAADEEVRTQTTATLEGKLTAGGITGFQITEARGPEDREVVAVDLAGLRLSGALLVKRTLRIRGRLEKRETGTLPNGTRILQDVFVAREVVEKTADDLTLTGTLEKRSSDWVVVERTPANAAPVDQDVEETAFEAPPGFVGASLRGKTVRVEGKLARKFVGAIRDRFLVERPVLIATSVVPAGP